MLSGFILMALMVHHHAFTACTPDTHHGKTVSKKQKIDSKSDSEDRNTSCVSFAECHCSVTALFYSVSHSSAVLWTLPPQRLIHCRIDACLRGFYELGSLGSDMVALWTMPRLLDLRLCLVFCPDEAFRPYLCLKGEHGFLSLTASGGLS